MLTEREQFILTHISMFGSDGYAAFVTKIKRQWHVQGVPAVFATKRAAVQQFENYLDVLRARKAGRAA